MKPADELHAAAKKLRTLADAATPGPWEGVVDDHGRGQVDASVWSDSLGYYITEKISSGDRHKDDAHYIAAMHPGVGEKIAGWLEREAFRVLHNGRNGELHHALAIARAINGTQP